ncbi:MAG TPA: FxsA family protein [Acidimicrobiales bacterium]|nr:FxsA family protein [Acidimicrobiales bacterium]
MLGALLLLLVIVPIIELYVIVQVATGIGVAETILLLIAISVVGAWCAKVAGIGVLNRFHRTIREGRVPSREVIDGALVLAAGGLMIFPGFVSDVVAILLLLPPTRAVLRGSILRRIRAGGGIVRVVRGRSAAPGVWDVESWEEPPGGGHPELGR